MFKHILIPTDGSDLSRKAILYGVQLAKEAGAKVTGLTVAEPYHAATMDTVLIPVDEGDYEEQSRLLSEKAMEHVKMAAQAAGVPCETIREVHDQPYRAIIDAAHARGCDLIVMASHGRRGISALLLGSETVKVLTHSTIPVLVYR
jgi:nucleotide-binding universal stress UspA family protein